MPDVVLADGQRETPQQRLDRLRRTEFLLESAGENLAAQRAVTEVEFRLKSTAVNKGLIGSVIALATGQIGIGGFGTAALLTYKSVELSKIETKLEIQTAVIEQTKAQLVELGAEIVQAELEADEADQVRTIGGSDKLVLDMPDVQHMDDPPTRG